jgi:hypothetical protein
MQKKAKKSKRSIDKDGFIHVRRTIQRVVTDLIKERVLKLSNQFQVLTDLFTSENHGNEWLYSEYMSSPAQPKKSGRTDLPRPSTVHDTDPRTCPEIKASRKQKIASMVGSKKEETKVSDVEKIVSQILASRLSDSNDEIKSFRDRWIDLGLYSEKYAYMAYEFLQLSLEMDTLGIKDKVSSDDYYRLYDEWVHENMWKLPQSASELMSALSDIVAKALGVTDKLLLVGLVSNLMGLVSGIVLYTRVTTKLDASVVIANMIASIIGMLTSYLASHTLRTEVHNQLCNGMKKIKETIVDMQNSIVGYINKSMQEPEKTIANTTMSRIEIERIERTYGLKDFISDKSFGDDVVFNDRITQLSKSVSALPVPDKLQKQDEAGNTYYEFKGYSPKDQDFYGDHWILPWETKNDILEFQTISLDFGLHSGCLRVPTNLKVERIRSYLGVVCDINPELIAVYNAEGPGFPNKSEDISDKIIGSVSKIQVVQLVDDGSIAGKWDDIMSATGISSNSAAKYFKDHKQEIQKLRQQFSMDDKGTTEWTTYLKQLGLDAVEVANIMAEKTEKVAMEKPVGCGNGAMDSLPTWKVIKTIKHCSHGRDFYTGGINATQHALWNPVEKLMMAYYAKVKLSTVDQFISDFQDVEKAGTLDQVSVALERYTNEDLEGFIKGILKVGLVDGILLLDSDGKYWGSLESCVSDEKICILRTQTRGVIDVTDPVVHPKSHYSLEKWPEWDMSKKRQFFSERNHLCDDCFRKGNLAGFDLYPVGDANVDSLATLMGVPRDELPDDFNDACKYLFIKTNDTIAHPKCLKRWMKIENSKMLVSSSFCVTKEQEGYYFTKEIVDSSVMEEKCLAMSTTLGGLHHIKAVNSNCMEVPVNICRHYPILLNNTANDPEVKKRLVISGDSFIVNIKGHSVTINMQDPGAPNSAYFGCYWGDLTLDPKVRVRIIAKEEQSLDKQVSVCKFISCALCVVLALVLTNRDSKARPVDYLKNMLTGATMGVGVYSAFEMFAGLWNSALEPKDQIQEMNELRKNLIAFNSIPSEVMVKSHDLLRSALKKIGDAHRFLATHELKPGANLPLAALINQLTFKIEELLKREGMQVVRPATFIMLIQSEPGLGKNHSFTERINQNGGSDTGKGLQRLRDICGDHMRVKWLRADNNGYWNELNGEQVTIYDEWAMNTKEPLLSMINQIGNTTPATFSGASVDSKHQMFLSDFLIMLTNRKQFPTDPQINPEAMDAIKSRVNYYRVTDGATERWLKANGRHAPRPPGLPTDIADMDWFKIKQDSNNKTIEVPTTWNEIWYDACVHYWNERQKVTSISVQRAQAELLGGVEQAKIMHPKALGAQWRMTTFPNVTILGQTDKRIWNFCDPVYDIYHKVTLQADEADNNLYIALHGPSGKGKTHWTNKFITHWKGIAGRNTTVYTIKSRPEYDWWIRSQHETTKPGDLIVTDDIFWEPWFNALEFSNNVQSCIFLHVSNLSGQFRYVKSPGSFSWKLAKTAWNNLGALYRLSTAESAFTTKARLFNNRSRQIREGELRRSGLYGNLFTPKANISMDKILHDQVTTDDCVEVSCNPTFSHEIEVISQQMWSIMGGAPTSPEDATWNLMEKIRRWKNTTVPVTVVECEYDAPTSADIEINCTSFDDLKYLLRSPDSMIEQICVNRGNSKIYVSPTHFQKLAQLPSLRGAAWQMSPNCVESDLPCMIVQLFKSFRVCTNAEVLITVGKKKFWSSKNDIYTTEKFHQWRLCAIRQSEQQEKEGKVVITLIDENSMSATGKPNYKTIMGPKMSIIRVLSDGIYGVDGAIELPIVDLKAMKQAKEQIFNHVLMIDAVTKWEKVCAENAAAARKASRFQQLRDWVKGDSIFALVFKIFASICLIELAFIGVKTVWNWFSGTPVIRCQFCEGSYTINKEWMSLCVNSRYQWCFNCNKWQTIDGSAPQTGEIVKLMQIGLNRSEYGLKIIDEGSPMWRNTSPIPPEEVKFENIDLFGLQHGAVAKGATPTIDSTVQPNTPRDQIYDALGWANPTLQTSQNNLAHRKTYPILLNQRETANQYLGRTTGGPIWPAGMFQGQAGAPLQPRERGVLNTTTTDAAQLQDALHGTQYKKIAEPYYVRQQLQAKQGTIMTVDHAQTKILKALVRVHGCSKLWGIMVKERYIMFPWHLMVSANDHGVSVTADVNGTTYAIANVTKLPDRDACIGELVGSQVPMWRDISNNFMRNEELDRVIEANILVAKAATAMVTPTDFMQHTYQGKHEDIYTAVNLRGTGKLIHTANGDCGSAYLGMFEHEGVHVLKYMGMHVALLGDHHYQAVVITKELIDAAINRIKNVKTELDVHLEQAVLKTPARNYDTMAFYKEAFENMKTSNIRRFNYGPPCKFICTMRRLEFHQEKTSASPWFKEISEVYPSPVMEVSEKMPPLAPEVMRTLPLNNLGKPDKIQKQIDQILENPKHENMSPKDFAELEAAYEVMKTTLSPLYQYEWQQLTPTASLNAVVINNLVSTPMRVNTSAGFYGHMRGKLKKNEFIKVGVNGLRTFDKSEPAQILLEYVRYAADKIKMGEPVLSVFMYNAKHEALPIDKALAGKVRMFSAASIEMTILERMFFLPIMTYITKTDGPIRTGYNELISLGRKHGALAEHYPHCASVDFSRFDKWVTKAEVFFALRFLCAMNASWAERGDTRVDKIAEAWTRMYTESPVYCKGDLFTTEGTLPSGILLTNILGGLIVYLRVIRAWGPLAAKLTPELPYQWHIYPLECGDDLTIYVSEEGKIPLDLVIKAIQDNGARVTTTSKDDVEMDEVEWSLSMQGTSFISRRVWYNEKYDQYWSPLKLLSIMKCLYFASAQAYVNSASLVMDVICEARALEKITEYNRVMEVLGVIIRNVPELRGLEGQLLTFDKAHAAHYLYIISGNHPMKTLYGTHSPELRKGDNITTANTIRSAIRNLYKLDSQQTERIIPSVEIQEIPDDYVEPIKIEQLNRVEQGAMSNYKHLVEKFVNEHHGLIDEIVKPIKQVQDSQCWWKWKYTFHLESLALPYSSFTDTEEGAYKLIWSKICLAWPQETSASRDDSVTYGIAVKKMREALPVAVFLSDSRKSMTVVVWKEDNVYILQKSSSTYSAQQFYDECDRWLTCMPATLQALFRKMQQQEDSQLLVYNDTILERLWAFQRLTSRQEQMEVGTMSPAKSQAVDVTPRVLPGISNVPPTMQECMWPQNYSEVHVDLSQRFYTLTECTGMQTKKLIRQKAVPGNIAEGTLLETLGGMDIMEHTWFQQKAMTHKAFGGHYYVTIVFSGVTNITGGMKIACYDGYERDIVEWTNLSICHISDFTGTGRGVSLTFAVPFVCDESYRSGKHYNWAYVGRPDKSDFTEFDATLPVWEITATTDFGSSFIPELTASTAVVVSTFVSVGHIRNGEFELTMEIAQWIPRPITLKDDIVDPDAVVGKKVGEIDPNSSITIWSTKGSNSGPMSENHNDYIGASYDPTSHFTSAVRGRELVGKDMMVNLKWHNEKFDDKYHLFVGRNVTDYGCPVKGYYMGDDGFGHYGIGPMSLYGTWPQIFPDEIGRDTRPYIFEEVDTSKDTWSEVQADHLGLHIDCALGWIDRVSQRGIEKLEDRELKVIEGMREVTAACSVCTKVMKDQYVHRTNCWGLSFLGAQMTDNWKDYFRDEYDITALDDIEKALRAESKSVLTEGGSVNSCVQLRGVTPWVGASKVELAEDSFMIVREFEHHEEYAFTSLKFKYVTIGSEFPKVVMDAVANAQKSNSETTPFMDKIMKHCKPTLSYMLKLRNPLISDVWIDIFLNWVDNGWMWGTRANTEYVTSIDMDNWKVESLRPIKGSTAWSFTDTEGWTSIRLNNAEAVRKLHSRKRRIAPAKRKTRVEIFRLNEANKARPITGRVATRKEQGSKYQAFVYSEVSQAAKQTIDLIQQRVEEVKPGTRATLHKAKSMHCTRALLELENEADKETLLNSLESEWKEFAGAPLILQETGMKMPKFDFLGQTLVMKVQLTPITKKRALQDLINIYKQVEQIATVKVTTDFQENAHVSLMFLRDATPEEKEEWIQIYEDAWRYLEEEHTMKINTYLSTVKWRPIGKPKSTLNRPAYCDTPLPKPVHRQEQGEVAAIVGGGLLQGLGSGLGQWAMMRQQTKNMKYALQFEGQMRKDLLHQKYIQNLDLMMKTQTMKGGERIGQSTSYADASTAMHSSTSTNTGTDDQWQAALEGAVPKEYTGDYQLAASIPGTSTQTPSAYDETKTRSQSVGSNTPISTNIGTQYEKYGFGGYGVEKTTQTKEPKDKVTPKKLKVELPEAGPASAESLAAKAATSATTTTTSTETASTSTATTSPDTHSTQTSTPSASTSTQKTEASTPAPAPVPSPASTSAVTNASEHGAPPAQRYIS